MLVKVAATWITPLLVRQIIVKNMLQTRPTVVGQSKQLVCVFRPKHQSRIQIILLAYNKGVEEYISFVAMFVTDRSRHFLYFIYFFNFITKFYYLITTKGHLKGYQHTICKEFRSFEIRVNIKLLMKCDEKYHLKYIPNIWYSKLKAKKKINCIK